MFWISFAAIVMSALLIKLGALSVMVAVLSFTLKSIVAVIIVLAGLLVCRWYRGRRITWRKV